MLRKDFYQYIIKPTLKEIGLDTAGAAILVYGTGMVESAYDHLVQIHNPKSGGLGFFQMEPQTYLDHVRWLENGFARDLKAKILQASYLVNFPKDPTVLCWNWKFATAMCRIDYYRVKEKIPTDATGLAQYHKNIITACLVKQIQLLTHPYFKGL